MGIAAAMLASPLLEAHASTAIKAAYYSITPNPIAAHGSLSPTAPVTLTLTAHVSGGAVAPNAIVWLNVVGWDKTGHWLRTPFATLTVHSTLLNTHNFGSPVYEYRVNSAGQLTMTFVAGSPGIRSGEAGVFAEVTGSNLRGAAAPAGCQALYQYAP
jgi:hypothetical protein